MPESDSAGGLLPSGLAALNVKPLSAGSSPRPRGGAGSAVSPLGARGVPREGSPNRRLRSQGGSRSPALGLGGSPSMASWASQGTANPLPTSGPREGLRAYTAPQPRRFIKRNLGPPRPAWSNRFKEDAGGSYPPPRLRPISLTHALESPYTPPSRPFVNDLRLCTSQRAATCYSPQWVDHVQQPLSPPQSRPGSPPRPASPNSQRGASRPATVPGAGNAMGVHASAPAFASGTGRDALASYGRRPHTTNQMFFRNSFPVAPDGYPLPGGYSPPGTPGGRRQRPASSKGSVLDPDTLKRVHTLMDQSMRSSRMTEQRPSPYKTPDRHRAGLKLSPGQVRQSYDRSCVAPTLKYKDLVAIRRKHTDGLRF